MLFVCLAVPRVVVLAGHTLYIVLYDLPKMPVRELMILFLLATVLTLGSEVNVPVADLLPVFFFHVAALIVLCAIIRLFTSPARHEGHATPSEPSSAMSARRTNGGMVSAADDVSPGTHQLSPRTGRLNREDDDHGGHPPVKVILNNKKYYVVRCGRRPGIYLNWPDCKKEVMGFPGARYKSFYSLPEAESFLRG